MFFSLVALVGVNYVFSGNHSSLVPGGRLLLSTVQLRVQTADLVLSPGMDSVYRAFRSSDEVLIFTLPIKALCTDAAGSEIETQKDKLLQYQKQQIQRLI